MQRICKKGKVMTLLARLGLMEAPMRSNIVLGVHSKVTYGKIKNIIPKAILNDTKKLLDQVASE